MLEKDKNNFIGYEYKEVTANSSKIPILLDGYECFGWKLTEQDTENAQKQSFAYQGKQHLHLKRDRHIINKTELTRLQRNFEACIREIDELEKSKTSKGTIYALIMGIIGTAFMAGATFAVTSQPPHILLCIILAVPGFIGWILPVFLYKKILKKETKRVELLIENKYDEIYEICEKGSRLLYTK